MNKATEKHSKKEKPGKEFLFPTVFAFSVIPSEGPEDRSRGICHCQQTSRLTLEVTESMLEETGKAGPSTAARGDSVGQKRGMEKAANAFSIA